jgi:pimeloyl-ACP methyl ester carboxylesterase
MSTRHRLMLVLCLVCILGGTTPPQEVASAQDAVAMPELAGLTVTPNDCAFLINGDDDPRERLGEIACGTLDVPENWSDPLGRRLQIGYVILESTGARPMPDPVVHLGGGPGISALSQAEPWAGVFAILRQDRDVVLFDQRGARLSSPLRCEAYSLDLAVDPPLVETDEVPAAPPAPPAYPLELSDPESLLQTARERYGPIADACANEIAEAGADLTQYNTAASANDVVALMKALGYDEYNLYGISYGTRLALEVMRDHPESGLRSVVLDSAYPPEIKVYEEFPQEPHQVVIQLFADCRRDAACDAAYPDLQARFVALLARLRASPVVSPAGATVTDRDLIGVMQTLGATIPAVPYVPRMIAELERGETETFFGIASGSLLAPADESSDVVGTPEVDDAAEAVLNAAALGDFSPARRFVLEVQARFEARAEPEASQFLALLSTLDTLAPERQTLREFIDRAFPGPGQAETRADFHSTIDAMSDAEVQEVFAVVAQTITLEDLRLVGQSLPQYYSVECNERIPFQSFANMVANAQRLEIPELALGVPEQFVKVFAICERWPSGQASESAAQPVWSDIPTLVLAGAYDNLTPVSWNKSAFVTLPNGVFVLAPMSGHGVIAYSACGQQLGHAFIADPSAPLDTACLADIEPQWVLPAAD